MPGEQCAVLDGELVAPLADVATDGGLGIGVGDKLEDPGDPRVLEMLERTDARQRCPESTGRRDDTTEGVMHSYTKRAQFSEASVNRRSTIRS